MVPLHHAISHLQSLCRLPCVSAQGISPDQYDGLHQLSGLIHMERLQVTADDVLSPDRRVRHLFGEAVEGTLRPLLPAQLLSSLTALTWLETRLCGVGTLAAISRCVHLKHLVACVAQEDGELGQDDWASLAPLTGLRCAC